MNEQTYSKRLDRVQDVLKDRGIDRLIIGPSADLTYLTGIHAGARTIWPPLAVHFSAASNLADPTARSLLPSPGNPGA